MQLNKKNKTLIILVILTLGSVGAIWGFASISERINKNEQNNVRTEENRDNIFSMGESLKNSLNNNVLKNFDHEEGRVNILLLGISGNNHTSGELTDSIMLISADTTEKNANIFSIPRDLWISDPNGEFQKINELYKIGGGTSTPSVHAIGPMKDKVEDITGQPIHYSGVIDLDGVEEVVDILGGIETEEGFMNGKEALWYIRDRSRPGGDFDRMARQQKLILAIMQKFKTMDIMQDINQVQKLYNVLEHNFAMDLTFTEMITLLNYIGRIEANNIGLHTITPEQEGLLYSDFSYWEKEDIEVYTLHPRTGMEDYSEIQEFINDILN